MNFDTYDLRDKHIPNGKALALPLLFNKKYGAKINKKLNNINEVLDYAYSFDLRIKTIIPGLKFFDYTYYTFNNIQSFEYSYYKVLKNLDEILVEIKFEKYKDQTKWSINGDFNVFFDSISDKKLRTIISNIVTDLNVTVNDCNGQQFMSEIKRLQYNIEAFFSQFVNI